MSKILFFIGMPGAGKTVWGKKLAAHFHWSFFDLDQYIEERESKTIAQLFELSGEAAFRKKETIALKNIVAGNEKPFVLSCGGGVPLNPSNFSLMKEHGCIVYLKAKIETLFHNLQHEAGKRPLLQQDKNFAVSLTELYEKRKKIYEQADYIFDVENLSLTDFESLQECINQH